MAALDRIRRMIRIAVRLGYTLLLMFLLISPGKLKAGNIDPNRFGFEIPNCFASSCPPIPPNFYPYTSAPYCNDVSNSAWALSLNWYLRVMDSTFRGYAYNPPAGCPPYPKLAYPYGAAPYCTDNTGSAWQFSLWWFVVSIDSAVSGGGGIGNISGTLTNGFLPMATGVHTIANSYLSQTTNAILVPTNVLLQGATNSASLDLNNSFLNDSHGFTSIDFSNNELLDHDGVTSLLSWGGGQVLIGPSLQYQDGNQGLNKVMTSDANGYVTWQAPQTGITGSGTANVVTKWSSSTGITNSQITDNGTNVAIGSLFNFNNNGGYGEFTVNDNTGKPFVFFNNIAASGIESYFLGDLTVNYRSGAPQMGLSVYPQITLVDTILGTTPVIISNNNGYGLIRALDVSNNEFFRINNGAAPGSVSYIKDDFTIDYDTPDLFGGLGVQGAIIVQTTGTAAPNPLAIIDCESTTKVFLPPQMTTVQKLAIVSPPPGGEVFDTTLNMMSYYNGTTWINF